MSERSKPHNLGRKARDQSMVLLLIGTVLLMPPVAGVFLLDGAVGPIPVPLFYVFTVWIVLIVGTAVLARKLRDADSSARVRLQASPR